MAARTDIQRRLSPDDVSAVRELVDHVWVHDGTTPLSEHVLLHLGHGGDEDVHHLLVRADGEADGAVLIGYAHLDATDLVEGPSAELCVHPHYRGVGVGTALVDDLIALASVTEAAKTGHTQLRLWAHGENAVAERLARARGFTRTRVLWQMRRSLLASLAPARLPAGITLRAFVPGQDDEAWIDINRQAFAHLPDQGAWTVDDLHSRMREPWFDPAGFLLAHDEQGRLLGFHWTKVHGNGGHGGGDGHIHHGHQPIGEVYVVGVSPAAQGTGLGRAMVLAGLGHLRAAGLTHAMLYVDASNTRAIRLYESLGFTRWDTDVLYAR